MFTRAYEHILNAWSVSQKRSPWDNQSPILGIISAIHNVFITSYIVFDVYMFVMFTRVSSHSYLPGSSQ